MAVRGRVTRVELMLRTAIGKNFTSLLRYQQVAALSSSVTMDGLTVAHTAQARVVSVADIVKSQNDDRSHRGLVLDNGLKVSYDRSRVFYVLEFTL